jgi:hypothetical protein
MRAQFTWIILVGMVGLFGAHQVHAEVPKTHGVIAIGGNPEERDLAAIILGLTTATNAVGWQAPAKALTKKETAGLLRCLGPGEPWECIPASLAAQGIRHTLVVDTKKEQTADGSPMMVLTAKLIVTRPHALIVQQRFCEHCSDAELTRAATELAQQLLQEMAVRIGRTLLAVKSVPSGARIVLDGEPIGATDTTFNTYPGSHVVIVEKPGYLTQTVSIEAVEGKTATVSVALHESPSTEKLNPSRFSRKVPLAVIGAGAASLVAAGFLIHLGQQDGPNDRRIHPRAATVGAIAGVAGVAAVGTGVYLWLRGSRASRSGGASASVVPGGVAIAWNGAF